ncbi:MAG: SDR family NAD(P)-dependent oxidoreductase [Chloroherpetonaceae bacterium]|nr:SDR family NAD(P)-dependent oxidoreductase [Chloroherpetonaceae bacterium]
MNVLVTGASGFIGANVARKLVEKKFPVTLLVREKSNLQAVDDILDKVTLRYGDVTDRKSIFEAMEGITNVYHCAGKAHIGGGKDRQLYAINVEGTRNVLEAAMHEEVKKVVYTSSVSAIGITGTKEPADENQDWNLDELNVTYFKTKHLAENEVKVAVDQGLDCVIVNPSYVFGEWDVNFNAGRLIKDLYFHKIPVYPTGGINVADVQNVVNGHLVAMEGGLKGERYILGGENLTYKEVFDTICRIVKAPRVWLPLYKSLVRLFVNLTADMRIHRKISALANREILESSSKYFYYSSKKAYSTLAYQRTPFDESIFRTFNWYKEKGLL